MDRSYVRLLVRFGLGLFICGAAWWALRNPRASNDGSTSLVSPGTEVVQIAAPPPPVETAAPARSAANDDKAAQPNSVTNQRAKRASDQQEQKMEQATFGGGCFWCVEAVLQRVEGVEKIVSGYAGGRTVKPTYEQVCTGRTGHAEVVQVTFDPAVVSYAKLLEIFMKTHDPTTLNQQGSDVGTQYRSIILTHSDEQARQATEIKEKLDASKIFGSPIVTAIEPLKQFYAAEEDHQDYFNRNPTNRYCQVVVKSKVEKLEKFFSEYMKSDAK